MRRALRALALLCAGLIVLLVVGWLGVRFWALHVVRTAVPEFEARHGSLDRSQWLRELPPPSENGGQYLRAAGLLADGTGEEWTRWYGALGKASGQATGDAVRADFAVVVERNRTALELMRAGAAKPACVLFDQLPEPAGDLAHAPGLFRLVRIERQLALDELARGAEGAAGERMVALLHIADCLERDPTLVVYLFGSALERMVLRDLRPPLAAGRLDGSLAAIRDALTHADYPPVADRIRAEAATFGPGAWWREGRWNRSDRLNSPANPLDVEGFLSAMTVRALGETLDTLGAPAPPPPASQHGWALGSLETSLKNTFRSYWAYERTARVQAGERALARAAVAVRARGLAAGRYPESLAGLDPALARPTPLAGEAIRYERGGDGSARLVLPASAKEWARVAALLELEGPDGSSYPGRFEFEWILRPLPHPASAAVR